MRREKKTAANTNIRNVSRNHPTPNSIPTPYQLPLYQPTHGSNLKIPNFMYLNINGSYLNCNKTKISYLETIIKDEIFIIFLKKIHLHDNFLDSLNTN